MTSFDEADFGYALLDDYVRAFVQHSKFSVPYAEATFHLLFGQLPGIRDMKIYRSDSSWLDPRIHPCYFSASGSGKGEGSNFLARMAERLGMRYQPVTKVTDSGLIGTINDEKKIEYGWLHQTHGINILAATEGSVILQDRPPKEAMNVMDLLQITMNTMGSKDSVIAKKIGFGEAIEFQPTTSLFFTTYVPTNLTDIVLQRGLLQRMYVVSNTTTLDMRRKVIDELHKDLMNPKARATGSAEESIVERLKNISKYYAGRDTIPFSKGAVEKLSSYTTAMFDMIRNAEPFLQEKLGEFISRLDAQQTRLSFQFAAMNKHDTVEPFDAQIVYDLHTSVQFYQLISFLERVIDVPVPWRNKFYLTKERVLTTIKRMENIDGKWFLDEATGQKWVERESLSTEIASLHTVTTMTAKIYIDQMKDWKLIEVKHHRGLQKEFVRPLGS